MFVITYLKKVLDFRQNDLCDFHLIGASKLKMVVKESKVFGIIFHYFLTIPIVLQDPVRE
jgi:hypothetical protein